jgi:murein DD-endopeptidase MepM/ murein hydrolase activator NlpD
MGRSAGSGALGRRRATAYGAGLAGVLALALAVPAGAQIVDGGGIAAPVPAPVPPAGTLPPAATPPTAPPPALGPTPFGVRPARPATIRSFLCVAGCADLRTPLTGALLRVRGKQLRGTDLVTFLGADGDADDVSARPLRRTRTAVDVRVPLGATTGPLTVTDRDGLRPASVSAPLTIAPGRAGAPRALTLGGPQVEVQVASPREFFDSSMPPHVTYVLHASAPADVTIEIVRAFDGTVVTSWPAGTIAPETPQTATWDGTVDGRVQRAGRYVFRVTAQPQGGAAQPVSEPGAGGATQALSETGTTAADDPSSFVFLSHTFPVRGPHYFGEEGARFGGGRGHRGQDVFAACGTPIVAARGGKVKIRGFQSAAGNYVVIDGARTGIDYGYMHLKSEALVQEGDRVRTGQVIGYMGDTGRASTCHLHFEVWTAPGWYEGGAAFDPLPWLLAWDRRS